MAPESWAKLREWLIGVFGEAEGLELYAGHVAEAQAAGLPTVGA